MKLIIDIRENYFKELQQAIKEDANSLNYCETMIANGTPITNGEFLLTLMQSVMTPEQLKEVLQKMTEDKYSEGYSDGYLDGMSGADMRGNNND